MNNSSSIEMESFRKKVKRPKARTASKPSSSSSSSSSDCKSGTATAATTTTNTVTSKNERNANSDLFRENYDIHKKRYQQWKGNNKFFLDGNIMLGPKVKHLILTICLVLTTWGVFFAIVFPHIPPRFQLNGVLLIISLCLLATMLTTLLKTALTDPGIIPHRVTSKLVGTMPLEIKENMNYCPICNIVRPPRTRHCRQMNCCVRRFDHHCPWTGNSVGERNYRWFFVFITSTTLSSMLNAFAGESNERKRHATTKSKNISQHPPIPKYPHEQTQRSPLICSHLCHSEQFQGGGYSYRNSLSCICPLEYFGFSLGGWPSNISHPPFVLGNYDERVLQEEEAQRQHIRPNR